MFADNRKLADYAAMWEAMPQEQRQWAEHHVSDQLIQWGIYRSTLLGYDKGVGWEQRGDENYIALILAVNATAFAENPWSRTFAAMCATLREYSEILEQRLLEAPYVVPESEELHEYDWSEDETATAHGGSWR